MLLMGRKHCLRAEFLPGSSSCVWWVSRFSRGVSLPLPIPWFVFICMMTRYAEVIRMKTRTVKYLHYLLGSDSG